MSALTRLNQRYLDDLQGPSGKENGDSVLGDICYSTLVGRCRHEYALCLYPQSYNDLISQLRDLALALNNKQASLSQPIEQVVFCLKLTDKLPSLDSIAWRGQHRFVEALQEAQKAIHDHTGHEVVVQDQDSRVAQGTLAWFCVHYATIRYLMLLGVQPDKVLYQGDMWLVAAVLWREVSWGNAIDQLLHGTEQAPQQLGRIPLEATELSGVLSLQSADCQSHTWLDASVGLNEMSWRNALGSLWAGGGKLTGRYISSRTTIDVEFYQPIHLNAVIVRDRMVWLVVNGPLASCLRNYSPNNLLTE